MQNLLMSPDLKYTSLEEIPAIFQHLNRSFRRGVNRSLDQRRANLRQVVKMLKENEGVLHEAMWRDLRKPKQECHAFEVGLAISDGIELLDNLDAWASPRNISFWDKPLVNAADRATIVPEPNGVVLIIGAWNFPIMCTMIPMLGSIAAGNTTVLKPSEVSMYTAALLAELLPRYLSPDVVRVVNGAIPETTKVLEQPFHHIFYTGSGAVGRIVMTAAAKHLAKVTLELGGKSPVVVDKNVDLATVGRRIMWGRSINSGQTCIAPDYIICRRADRDALVEALRVARTEFLGENVKLSDSYARIVSDAHFRRIRDLMQHGRVVVGGEVDAAQRFIAPTVLVDVPIDSPLMQQEIFGPLLPIITLESIDEAVNFINDRDKPLALYLFTNDKDAVHLFEERVSCGGMTVNDVLMHAGPPCLPFGGVGASGMGRYHGKYTFDEFTHMKPVLAKSLGFESMNAIRYAPYSEKKIDMVTKLVLHTSEKFRIL